MPRTGTGVRPGRSDGAGRAVVGVTGADGPLGVALLERLGPEESYDVRAVDVTAPDVAGIDTVVHLAGPPDSGDSTLRAGDVDGTRRLLAAAEAAGVERVVLVTSAMVYGAYDDNPVPLPEDAPLRAEPDGGAVGDWVEMERLADAAERVDVVRVRPAAVVGSVTDPVLPRLFDAPRLLVISGSRPRYQFCHVDDLVSAVVHVLAHGLSGVVTVGSDGWLDHEQVERLAGMRSVVVPPAVAYATAERLHRIGVLPAPASELRFVADPWVVGSQRLRAAEWRPAWTNEAALRAHLDATRTPSRLLRVDRSRAAAGAAVAVAGTVALARARARRRRG